MKSQNNLRKHWMLWLGIVLVASSLMSGCATKHDYVRNVSFSDRVKGFTLKPGQKVAVLTFTGSTKGKAVGDLLSIELLRKGVNVIERDSFDRLLAELRRTEAGLFNADLSNEEVIKKLGQVIGVDVIIVGEAYGTTPKTIRLSQLNQNQLTTGLVLVASVALMPIGLIVLATSNDTTDYGESSPFFKTASSSIAVRMFSAKDGKVVWWGSTETLIHGDYGDHVSLLDFLRIPTQELAEAMMDPKHEPQIRIAEGDEIPVVFRP